VPVSLDPDALHRKLIDERRGGYCFEHNLLLKSALESLGAEVDLMLARVRVGAPPGTIRPRTHLVLRVRAEGRVWHADVGFGSGTLLEPIPFGPGEVHEQSGWKFRVVPEGEELVLPAGRAGPICTGSSPSQSRGSTSRPATGLRRPTRVHHSSPG
jgi:N-hydroxyarylamine O-acetyltransferase